MQGSVRQISCFKNQKNEQNCDQGDANLQSKDIGKINLGFKRGFSNFSDHPNIKTQTGKTAGRYQNRGEKGKNSKKSRTQLTGNYQGQQEKKESVGRSSSKYVEGIFYHAQISRLQR